MNIVVLHENLSAALTKAGKFLPSKTSVVSPVNNFYLSAEKGVITLQSTDLETSYTVTVPGKVEEEGIVLLPAKTTPSLIASFSGEKITLRSERGTLIVSGESSEARLRLENAENYPVLHSFQSRQVLELPVEKLTQIVVKNGFVVSSDPARPALTGILFSVTKERLTTVSTDGFRLSVCSSEHVEIPWEAQVIIPGKAVRAFLDIQQGKNSVQLLYDAEEARVSVMGEGEQIVTRLIEGPFPSYEKIIPTGHQMKMVVDRQEFLRAIKLSSVFAREAANIVKLKISQNELTVSARAAQTGENNTTLAISSEGDELETAFNYRYLQDVVSSLDSETITFESNGPLQAGVFYGEEKESFFHIVMPVRLQESK